MTLGSLRRRLTAVLMAVAILLVGAPTLPVNAATDCDHMAMTMSSSMQMTMDMKSAPAKSDEMPGKPGFPCDDNLSCLGGAGCAAPAMDQVSIVSLPRIATADANWASQSSGPSVSYKPAVPPPRA
jgi:hypothetical protein